MVESKSANIVWAIKKEDFLSGNFKDATFELGNLICSLSSINKKPLQGDTVSLTLSFAFKKTTVCTMVGCFQVSGVIYLNGLDGRYSVMKAWTIGGPEAQLKVDNSLLSFDEKYLFSDGTYRIGINVRQDISMVDFTSPDHALILGPSDAGCLLIEEEKLYVSKSYFSAQSPYFKALFFGDFKEKSQEVIVLNDVKFDIFREFLKHFYAEFHRVQGSNNEAIPAVLALADMFLCNTVARSCETVLVRKTSFTVVDLELADKYRLNCLLYEVIAVLPIVDLKTYLAQIGDSPESLFTRHFILDRIEEEARL